MDGANEVLEISNTSGFNLSFVKGIVRLEEITLIKCIQYGGYQ